MKYTTPITPAPWALFIWDYIYLWIFAMFTYFLVGLCRRLHHFLTFSHTIFKIKFHSVYQLPHTELPCAFILHYCMQTNHSWAFLSLHVADCSRLMWLFVWLQAQCVCCGAFPQTNLTIWSLLPAGMRLTGCTRHLQCCPMDSMSLLSSMLAWIFHGCFCLTESKYKTLKPLS